MPEQHHHYPTAVAYILAILVGLGLMIVAYYDIFRVGLGWDIAIGIVGFVLIIVGFLKLFLS